MIRKIGSVLVALTITTLALLAAASPASAAEHTPDAAWAVFDATGEAYPYEVAPAADSEIESPTSVLLTAGADATGGTSAETTNLGFEVDAGAKVTFHYELLDGATCGGGAPRAFLYDSPGANTMLTAPWVNSADADQPCGVDGVVTFIVPAAATIGTAGLVYDSGAGGSVRITDLSIDGTLILFTPRPDASSAQTPTPTEELGTPSPEPTTTQSPTTADATPDAGDDEYLPVTGSTLPVLGIVAAAAIAAGLLLIHFTHRRRSNVFTAEWQL